MSVLISMYEYIMEMLTKFHKDSEICFCKKSFFSTCAGVFHLET